MQLTVFRSSLFRFMTTFTSFLRFDLTAIEQKSIKGNLPKFPQAPRCKFLPCDGNIYDCMENAIPNFTSE